MEELSKNTLGVAIGHISDYHEYVDDGGLLGPPLRPPQAPVRRRHETTKKPWKTFKKKREKKKVGTR